MKKEVKKIESQGKRLAAEAKKLAAKLAKHEKKEKGMYNACATKSPTKKKGK